MALVEQLVCVIGEIDLVYALALAGLPSAIIAKPNALACHSRSTREIIGWIDPWVSPEHLVERLVEWGDAREAPPVLFYDGDWDLLLVSRHRDSLAKSFGFVVPDAELVEDTMDKERFQALADRLDLPVPRAVRLEPGAEWNGELSALRFPVVLKPLTRQHATWKGVTDAKAMRAESRSALDGLRPLLDAAEMPVIAQEEIPGAETRIESHHAYVDSTGAIAAEFTGRKLRTYPATYGYSCALEITDAPDVATVGREILERIGLRGVVKLDFKRTPEGALKLLEVNPRFSLWHYPGARAGVNIPEIVHCDLTGRPRPPRRRARAGVRWISPHRDRVASRSQGIGLARWLVSTLSAEAIHGFRWSDPMPFVHGAAQAVRGRLSPKGIDPGAVKG
jgi:D-aspartate ligase